MSGNVFERRSAAPPPITTIPQALRELFLANRGVQTSFATRQCLGTENVAAVQNLIAGSDMMELDALFLAGQLSEDQMFALVRTLPEFSRVRREIYVLARRIADSLFIALSTVSKPDVRLYGDILKRFFGFCEAVLIDGRPTFRNGRIDELRKMVIERFIVSSTRYLKASYPDVARDVARFWSRFSQRDLPVAGNVAALFSQVELGNELFHPHASSRPTFPVPPDADLTLLPFMLEELFRLTEMHAISREDFSHGDFVFALLAPPDLEDQALRFCDVFIMSPAVSREKVLMCVFDRGNHGFILDKTTASFDLFLDQHTQDILRYVIADRLLQQLYAAEDARLRSVRELLAAAESAAVCVGNHADEAPCDTEFDATDAEWSAPVFDRSAYVRDHVARTVPESVSATVGVPPMSGTNLRGNNHEDVQHRVAFLQRLPSLSGRDVVDAFARLVGSPIRQNGSHVMFRSLSGKTFPIPLHAEQSLHPGIVLRGMKTFGITPQKMLEALG